VEVLPANSTSHLDPPVGPLAGDAGLLGSPQPLAPATSDSTKNLHGDPQPPLLNLLLRGMILKMKMLTCSLTLIMRRRLSFLWRVLRREDLKMEMPHLLHRILS